MTKQDLIAKLTELFDGNPKLPDPSSVQITLGSHNERTSLEQVVETFPYFHFDQHSVFPDGKDPYVLLFCQLEKDDRIGFVLRVPLTEFGTKVSTETKTEYVIPDKSM